MTDDRTVKIQKQNDLFRKNFGNAQEMQQGVKGKYHITSGIAELPVLDQFKITMGVRNFNNFTQDNDPYGEHDMGRFKENGHTIFWKIDYYDTQYLCGSDDPSDPKKTRRVLTAMLSHEY